MKTRKVDYARDGALLITLIVALLVLGVLGGAALSMATSSRYQRIHAGMANRAYYLAESGAAYVNSVRMLDTSLAPSGTFTLSNGDQFMVHTIVTNGQVTVQSTGIANPGTHIEARRRLHFVASQYGDTDVLPMGFDFDDDGTFDDDVWTAVNVDPKIRSTGPSGGQAALDLKGEEGHIYLNWQSHPELNLQTVWTSMGGLLSYDAQVKIKPFDTGQQAAFSHHYMLGISFRMQDVDHCYGISFFRSHAGTNPGQTPSWVNDMPQAFQNLRGTNVYLVVWHRNGAFNSLDLMDYRLLTPSDPVIEIRNNNPELKDYSTMLLELEEVYGSDGARENRIRAYIQGTDVYPLWETNQDAVWQEDADIFPGPVTWNSGATLLVDARITSEDFALNRPAEVGIHVLYDREGANLKFFDDFALRVEGYGATQSQQIQY